MSKREVDRRTFAQIAALALGAATLPSVPAWAQSGATAKKRSVVIGHTGITWPGRVPSGRRGGGPGTGAPGGAVAPAATSPPLAAGGSPAVPAAAPQGAAPTPGAPGAAGPGTSGGQRGGPPAPPDPALNETIFKDVSELGFAGLELFDWQINGLESQGLLGQFVEKYKLPLISSYTNVNLTDPAMRAQTIAAAVSVGQTMKKYGGKTIVIGPSGRVGGQAYNFAEHKANIVATLNELGKAITDIGLIAALHQHTGTAVETRDETYQTMEAVDTRYVKFGPDIGQLQKGGVDPVEVVKHFLPVVQHMHFKDWDGLEGGAGYCPLGQGKVNLIGVLDLMEGRKIEGMIMVELDGARQLTPRDATLISRDYLVKQGVTMTPKA
jgi:inosose dehydratase